MLGLVALTNGDEVFLGIGCFKVHWRVFEWSIKVEMWPLRVFPGYLKKFKAVKDESLGFVLRLKVLRLSALSRSQTIFGTLSRLGLVSVSSREKMRQFLYCPGPVSLLQLYSVSVWFLSGCVVINRNKPNIQSFSSIKVGSCLGLVKRDTTALSLA